MKHAPLQYFYFQTTEWYSSRYNEKGGVKHIKISIYHSFNLYYINYGHCNFFLIPVINCTKPGNNYFIPLYCYSNNFQFIIIYRGP